jgi:HK97 family phage portal protein
MGLFARAATKAFDQGAGTLAVGRHIVDMRGSWASTGELVSSDSGLAYPAFWTAVRIIAETMSQMEVDLNEVQPLWLENGMRVMRRRAAYDHPLYPLLRGMAGPRLVASAYRDANTAHVAVTGNSYAARNRDGRGITRELVLLDPERMQVRWPQGAREGDDVEPVYQYTRRDGGGTVDMSPEDVLHVPGPGWSGLQGLSPLHYLREAVGLGRAAVEHGSRFFKNGATASVALTTPKGLSDKAFGHLKRQIDEQKVGLGNSWKPWLLEEGMQPVTLSVPNDDAQWLETREQQVLEVARAFRLPPHMLAVNAPGAVSYSSAVQFRQDFVTLTMGAWITRYEDAIGAQLVGNDWSKMGGRYEVRMDTDELMRGDMPSMVKAHEDAIAAGYMSRNEARARHGWEPVQGLDTYLVPLNMTTTAPDGTIVRTELAPAGAAPAEDQG